MRPPEFTRKLNDLTINDGEQLELCVKVSGDPEPQITWSKGGKVYTNKILSMQCCFRLYNWICTHSIILFIFIIIVIIVIVIVIFADSQLLGSSWPKIQRWCSDLGDQRDLPGRRGRIHLQGNEQRRYNFDVVQTYRQAWVHRIITYLFNESIM